MPTLRDERSLDAQEKTRVIPSSLERWCDESGGDYWEEGGDYSEVGCDLGGIQITIDQRSTGPNWVELRAEGQTNERLGWAKDAELAYGDNRNWVETTETTVGLWTDDRVAFQEPPTAKKRQIGQRRRANQKTSHPWNARR
jgi:hypothetical protein